MQVVLRQEFPLGRFHATPWRVNPFDDPHGEWPPSPWRLVRTVVARWYQWVREASAPPDPCQLDHLVAALCTSSYAFHLPLNTKKGSPLRQYFPQEFGWNPKGKDTSGIRGYSTSLAQDNYWCVPTSEDSAVWWFLDGERWNDSLLEILDRCLERVTYFGRAETFTHIRRAFGTPPRPNCEMKERRIPTAVPVLVPCVDATRANIERVTDDPDTAGRPIRQGLA